VEGLRERPQSLDALITRVLAAEVRPAAPPSTVAEPVAA
jgi:hypothetical protein